MTNTLYETSNDSDSDEEYLEGPVCGLDVIKVGGISSPGLQLRGRSNENGNDLSTGEGGVLRLDMLGRFLMLAANTSRNAERGVPGSEPGETGIVVDEVKNMCFCFPWSQARPDAGREPSEGAAEYIKAPSI